MALPVVARPGPSRYHPRSFCSSTPETALPIFRQAGQHGIRPAAYAAGNRRVHSECSRTGGHLTVARGAALTAIAVGVPFLAAILTAVTRRQPRVIGFAAALISVMAV